MADETKPPEEEGQPPSEHEVEPEDGPLARQRAFLEERLARIRPKEEAAEEEAAARAGDEVPQKGPKEEPSEEPEADRILGPAGEGRRDRIREYRRRQRERLRRGRDADDDRGSGDDSGGSPERGSEGQEANEEEGEAAPPQTDVPEPEAPQPPAPPPANNWIPIGPSVLRQGQGGVKPPTSGRVPGIAVAPGGTRVYVASANGGVWRSGDTGRTWVSLMEAFDLNPTAQAADSLACGAIAIVPGPPDRIYVGTGEGDSGAYFGVGPVVSFDGGVNWATEAVASGSPALAGSAFYALAVDPGDSDRVVGGTRQGVYRREPDGSGGFHWARKTMGAATWVTSVVAARLGSTTTFYGARWGGPVYSSTDGNTWNQVGAGFPTSNVARVGLAVQPGNPNVIYALVARADNSMLHGVYRQDISDGTWRQVSGAPAALFGPSGQGWYDLAMAVDPNDVNRIYLGGATELSGGDWSASLYRCAISVAGTAVSMTPTYIGNSVHADVHTITFAPGDSSKLWVGCDGGVFYSTNPTGTGDIFEARNTGLATLTLNYLGQHPAEDAVLFAGTQDNGGIRFTGEEAWLYSSGGDGGFAVINWNDPYKVLSTYVRGGIRRSTDGGSRYSYSNVNVALAMGEGCLFYAPIAGTPPNPGSPAEAEIVAFGSVRPWISTTFGGGWQSIPNGTLAGDSLNGNIRSLTFASATRLYAGTMAGGVYRFDRVGTAWSRARIDTMGGTNALPLAGPVTDIAVDPADATGASVYLTFGGTGDYRHVWRFDGAQWQQRSGPSAGAASSLLDVQASAIAVDPANPSRVYVGADIGIWRSTDGGGTWTTLSEGLPDAAVLDLMFHAPRRLLRAATHGRGVFERAVDLTTKPGVELWVRDTQLDQGRFATTNGLPDPTAQGQAVVHYRGPDIKLDTPDVNGQYQFPLTGTIDFLQFVDQLSDDFQNVATHATATITTRVYVDVHNRGVTPANNVRVMLLLANASAGLPSLPAGYATNVQTGTPITTSSWRTVGFVNLNDVRPGFPKIAAFNLTSNLLPPPANLAGNQHHCVLALIHHVDDQFTATQTVTDWLSLGERKAAHKNLTVVQFTGTVPPELPLVLPFRISNARLRDALLSDVLVRLGGYPGRVRLYLPDLKIEGDLQQQVKGASVGEDFEDFLRWAGSHVEFIKRNQGTDHPYDPMWSEQRISDIELARSSGVMLEVKDREAFQISRIILPEDSYHTMFLVFDPPPEMPVGRRFNVEIQQLDGERKELLGGISTEVDFVPEPKLVDDVLRRYSFQLSYRQNDFLKRFAAEYDATSSEIVRALLETLHGDAELREKVAGVLMSG